MGVEKTIIISCAGMGTRLGIGCPKALVDVDGEPLIIRTLKMLEDCKDIRIVVGYQAEKVIEVVNGYRKDIVYVFNHDYMNNGTGASVRLACRNAKKMILTIDGDLLIHPEDLKSILQSNEEFIGVTTPGTDNPVLTTVKDGKVVEFSREKGDYEWTGVCQLYTENLAKGDKHLYYLLEPSLPLKYKFIRTKEVDTPNDYNALVNWVKNNYSDEKVIGILGGMGSYATLDIFKRVLDMYPCEKEWERPRVIIDNYCTLPSRVRAVLYGEQKQYLKDMLKKSLDNLINLGCTHIMIGCNTAHILIKELYEENKYLKHYIIDMIDVTAKKIKDMGTNSCYLMASEGTIDSKVYNSALELLNISCKNPSQKDYEIMRAFIESVKQNNITKEIKKQFVDYVNGLKYKYIVLGCTELPVLYNLLNDTFENKVFIDPIECVLENIKR